MKRLKELQDTMADIAEEMNELAALDKERNQSAVVQLSRKSVLKNKEMDNSPSPSPVARAARVGFSPHGEAKNEFSNVKSLDQSEPHAKKPVLVGVAEDEGASEV